MSGPTARSCSTRARRYTSRRAWHRISSAAGTLRVRRPRGRRDGVPPRAHVRATISRPPPKQLGLPPAPQAT